MKNNIIGYLIGVILILVLILATTTCGSNDNKNETTKDIEKKTLTMTVIPVNLDKQYVPSGEHVYLDHYYYILVDNNTGVCYLEYNNYDTGYALTPLLNADGTPIIYGKNIQ